MIRSLQIQVPGLCQSRPLYPCDILCTWHTNLFHSNTLQWFRMQYAPDVNLHLCIIKFSQTGCPADIQAKTVRLVNSLQWLSQVLWPVNCLRWLSQVLWLVNSLWWLSQVLWLFNSLWWLSQVLWLFDSLWWLSQVLWLFDSLWWFNCHRYCG